MKFIEGRLLSIALLACSVLPSVHAVPDSFENVLGLRRRQETSTILSTVTAACPSPSTTSTVTEVATVFVGTCRKSNNSGGNTPLFTLFSDILIFVDDIIKLFIHDNIELINVDYFNDFDFAHFFQHLDFA